MCLRPHARSVAGREAGRISDACPDNGTRVRQRLVPCQTVIFSTKNTCGSSARCGQRLKAKSGKNEGRADVPWIWNHEGAWAVVKCAEANCLFVLGHAHKGYETIRSQPSYALN